jgi:hypothetical protein
MRISKSRKNRQYNGQRIPRLPLWYLLAIVLSVRRRFTDSDYLFGIVWPLYCLFVVDLLILIAPLVSLQWPKDTKKAIRISKSTKNRQYNGQKIPKGQSESVNRRRTENFWPLYYLFCVDLLIRITPLVSFGHCIVCSSSIYWFWLPLWYPLAIVEGQTIQWPQDTKRDNRKS